MGVLGFLFSAKQKLRKPLLKLSRSRSRSRRSVKSRAQTMDVKSVKRKKSKSKESTRSLKNVQTRARPKSLNIGVPSMHMHVVSASEISDVDEDKDRFISPQEMKSLCAKYGWNVNPNQLKSIFRYFDADDSGEIDATEFFKALNKYKLQKHIYPDKERIEKERADEENAS